MGRYAQNRRRGGSPPTPPVITPALTILSVAVSGATCLITFNGPVTVNVGALADNTFFIGGVPAIAAAGGGGSTATLAFGSSRTSGQPWLLTSPTPAFCTQVVNTGGGTTI